MDKELINEKKLLLISPLASAPELTGIDDYFPGVIPDDGLYLTHMAFTRIRT